MQEQSLAGSNNQSIKGLIKGRLYLPYLALKSTLSRVDFFIERLPSMGDLARLLL